MRPRLAVALGASLALATLASNPAAALEDLDDEVRQGARAASPPEREQLPVDWSDADVSRARSALEKSPQARARAAPSDGAAPLTLPRWGFGQDITKSSGDERARSLTAREPRTDFTWPACAQKTATPVTVRDETGSWYTDNYDFGCLSVSVSGDRNVDPGLKVAAAPAPDCELREGRSAAAGASVPNHPEDDMRGSFDLEVKLQGVPYTISGSCLAGAEDFCQNRAAQCALVERLVFTGGQDR